MASLGWRLEAAITLTDTEMRDSPPTRISVPDSNTRKSLTCSSMGISVISSRNRVPPDARSKWPAPLVSRAREAATLVTEQLTLDQGRCDRAAVDRDEGLVAS
jgi:hypothetical protein